MLRQLEIWGQRAGVFPARALAWVHDITARGLLWTGRCLGRFLAHFPWSCKLGALAAVAAVLSLLFGDFGSRWVERGEQFTPGQLELLAAQGWLAAFDGFCVVGLGVGLVAGITALLSFVRWRWSYHLSRLMAVGFALYWLVLLVFIIRVPGVLFAATEKDFGKHARNAFWIDGVLLWLVPVVAVALYLLAVNLAATKAFYYRCAVGNDLLGDRIVRNLRTHGGDPLFRTSLYWSLFAHAFVIVIVPVVLMHGCSVMDAYAVPLGSGVPNPGGGVARIIEVKRIKRARRAKPKVRFVLNMNSAISFYRPDITESKVLDGVQEDTLDTWVATMPEQTWEGQPGTGGGGRPGRLGRGGGTKGGWPHGMANAKVRFIRLKYNGADWDHNMGRDADYNLLTQFNQLTGFQIAPATEAVSINDLKHFPKHRAPPFVYLTASRGGMELTAADVKTLRWYCLNEGGMVFADNGGGDFDWRFRQQMRRVFPELEWVDIASDDIIFRQPYVFPNGAPPLWHHSGNRALGLKYNGRWVLFYHQGDLGDAWRTGHSGATQYVADQAYRMGVNVMNYAFNQYLTIQFGE